MKRSSRQPDVIVIGAGIIGTACAYELAAHGLDVLVIDRAGVGGGVTAAGMGHLVVMDDSPAEFVLSAHSRKLWLELAPHLDARHAFVRCGTLWVAADDDEFMLAQRRQQMLARQGIHCAMLDAQALREAEPALQPGLRGAMLVPDDAVVYPPAVAAWLLAQPVAGRITQRLDTTVISLTQDGVRLSTGDILAAGAVLLANGLQATALLPRLPLYAKKGHLLITDRYPGMLRHQILELGYLNSAHQCSGASVACNVQPRPTGQLLIGSSRQCDSTDATVEPVILAQMLRRAVSYLPMLSGLNAIRAWAGMRPATRDGLPLIGPAPACANDGARQTIWLALGHEGLGITTALGTAKLIAAQMLDLPAPFAVHPYLPTRAMYSGATHA